jgi:hypothetical protein
MPKKIDLTNKKFGEWTVLREATKEEKDNKPGAYWVCKCSCGTIKIVNGQTLRKGESRSCGCKLSQHLSEKLSNKNCDDLTGRHFGQLTVLKRDYETEKQHSGNTYWLCECKCGKQVSVVRNSLISGKTKSCGCLRKKISSEHLKKVSSNNFINEIGNKYGKLTVIKKAPSRAIGGAMWLCKCDCGNTVIVSGNSLRTGNTQSCGCLGHSKGEFKIERILKENNISFIKEYPVIINKRIFRFDFAIFQDDKLQYFIEYDGKQHFEPVEFFGGKDYYEYIKDNDNIKNNYCIINNIPLIRISYLQYDNIEIKDLLLS